MSLLQIKLPWWLSNKPVQDLKKIALACWGFVIEQINKVFDVCHVSTCPEECVDILWSELPIQPKIDKADRRQFIIHYSQYLEYLGTYDAIMLTQEMFNLAVFDIEKLRDTPNAPYHPWFAMRIYLSWDPNLTERIRSFIQSVAPARCKSHTSLVPHVDNSTSRFGSNRFGRRFG